MTTTFSPDGSLTAAGAALLGRHGGQVGRAGPAEMAGLVADFVYPEHHRSPWGVYLSEDDGSDIALAARWVERQVWLDAFGLHDQEVAAEYDQLAEVSTLSVVVHHPTGRPVGMLRLTWGLPQLMKTVTDLAAVETWRHVGWTDAVVAHGLDPATQVFMDCPSLAVLPEWRNSDQWWPAKLTLCSLIHQARAAQVNNLLAVLDTVSARTITMLSGTPFYRLCDLPPAPYLGSPSFPALLSLDDLPTWFRPRGDAEFAAAFFDQDRRGRGGTMWPASDFPGTSVVQAVARRATALHAELLADDERLAG